MKRRKLKNIFGKTIILFAFLFLTSSLFAGAADQTVGQTSVGGLFHFPWSNTTGIGNLVKQIYLIALGIVGALALGMIIFGGLQYSMSAGDPSRQRDARDRITQALWGVVLLLSAYLILKTINPELVNIKEPELQGIIEAHQMEFYITQEQLDAANEWAESHNIYMGHNASGAGIISGQELNPSRSIQKVGSQWVQGHEMSFEAAQNFLKLRNEIIAEIGTVGPDNKPIADIKITSTVTGQHESKCHQRNDPNVGGTCADFIVVFDSGVKNKDYVLNKVREILKNSSYVHSCLDEYLVKTQYSTGPHFHCNF